MYVAASEQRPLPLVQRVHLFFRQTATISSIAPRAPSSVAARSIYAWSETFSNRRPTTSEDLVGPKLFANVFQLVEQSLEHPSLARLSGNQVDNDDWVALLPVAVDAAHALFQAGRIPGYVVVHHQPAELEIDTLAGGVGGDQIGRPALVRRLSEQLNLCLPLAVVEPTVDQCDLAGEAQSFETPDEEFRAVAVLGKDDEFLMAKFGSRRPRGAFRTWSLRRRWASRRA